MTLIRLLEQFNFTESEAKVYVAFLENGPCTGYEISKLSGVPRSKIYNIIECLIQKGALSYTQSERAKIYRAESVDTLSTVIRKKTDANLAELKQASAYLSPPKADQQIWELADWDIVQTRAINMIQSAQDQLMVQIWSNELTPAIEAALLKKEKELEKFIIIYYDLEKTRKTELHRIYHHGFEEEKLKDMNGRWMLITVDRNHMLYANLNETGMTKAIYTEEASMALFAREYILHDAYCLRILEHLRASAVEEFGATMKKVRDVFKLNE